jgi:hypothetical protein
MVPALPPPLYEVQEVPEDVFVKAVIAERETTVRVVSVDPLQITGITATPVPDEPEADPEMTARLRFDERVIQRAQDMRDTAEMARIVEPKGGGDGKPKVVLAETTIMPKIPAGDETIASGVTAKQIRDQAEKFSFTPLAIGQGKKRS